MLKDGMHFFPWQESKIADHCIVVGALLVLKKM